MATSELAVLSLIHMHSRGILTDWLLSVATKCSEIRLCSCLGSVGAASRGVHPYQAVKALSCLAGRMNQGRANSLLTFSSEQNRFPGAPGRPHPAVTYCADALLYPLCATWTRRQMTELWTISPVLCNWNSKPFSRVVANEERKYFYWQ